MTHKRNVASVLKTGKTFLIALTMMGFLGGGLITTSLIINTVTATEANAFGDKKRHGPRGRFANLSDEQVEKRIGKMVKHVAVEIDATDEQQRQMTGIVSDVAKDIRPMRTLMRETRGEIKALLLSETVDRDAIEALRTTRLAELDKLTARVTEAMVEVAAVLTPDQRQKLAERIEDFGPRRWRRRWE